MGAVLPPTNLLDQRITWLRERVNTLPNDARTSAAATWPKNLPRAASKITAHTEIDEIARHLAAIEATHQLAFNPPDPFRPVQPRAQRPLWWYHRHIREDEFTLATQAIVDAEIAAAGDQAAIEAADLDTKTRARQVATAQHRAESYYQPLATSAVEHYVAAKRHETERQRRNHIDRHGCHQGCALLRGRLR